jgi:hypothetical protein
MPLSDKEHNWLEEFEVFVENMSALEPGERIVSQEYGLEPSFPKFVLTEEARSWDDFLLWANRLAGWCFRGQQEASWLLTTSLDRIAYRETKTEIGSSGDHIVRPWLEDELLFRFQQQAPRHLQHLPASSDRGSWLAIMQHYGAPTRFLDWTASPYVGMYFALEKEPVKDEKCSALWAIDLDWLQEKGEELVSPLIRTPLPASRDLRAQHINQLLEMSSASRGVVLQVDPIMGNDRLASQQGILLSKFFPEAPFFGILMRMMIHPKLTERPVIRKLEISCANRISFLRHLHKMNVHRSSLFPGLDGIGQYLKLDAEMKEQY